jgi:hypothetical protein
MNPAYNPLGPWAKSAKDIQMLGGDKSTLTVLQQKRVETFKNGTIA